MALSAFAMLFIVFILTAFDSPGLGNGAKASAPPGTDATTTMPRKLDP
jgi:hypothetical protein